MTALGPPHPSPEEPHRVLCPGPRTTHPTRTSGRAPGGRLRLRIFAVVLFAEIAALQYTMVASAARHISPSFPGVGANISWMVIIFGLVGGATTPLFGKMPDLWANA